MDVCGDHSEPIKSVSNVNYLLKKCLWCLKYNNTNSHIRLSKYIEQIIQLSTISFVSYVDVIFFNNSLIMVLYKT